MGRTFLDIDMARAADLLGMEKRQAEMFRDLERGRFMALGPALARRPLAVRVGTVETESRGAGPGLMPLPETTREAAHALILRAAPAEAPRPRRVPAAPPPDLLAQLAAARPAAPAALPPPSAEEEDGRRRAQLAVLRTIMAEPQAAFRPVVALHQDYQLRCRIEMLPGRPLDLPAFRRLLTLVLAGVTEALEAQPEWPLALDHAAALPEDRQGAYLLLARAAIEGAACPSDLAIARVLGSVSRGRGRSALEFIEKQGAIACRPDAASRRIVTIIGPGWETAPGDPEAAAA
jgi:hypothetical protein